MNNLSNNSRKSGQKSDNNRIDWKKENESLGKYSRYARSWKWERGQNGPMTKRMLTPQEIEQLGIASPVIMCRTCFKPITECIHQ